MLLQGLCTALPAQAKRKGASEDLAEAPQQKPITWVGKTWLLLTPPMDINWFLFIGLLMEGK